MPRRGVPPHGGRGRAVAHQTPRRTTRWRVRAARQGRPVGGPVGQLPGAFRTGRITVARTCVLIKTASHLARTCVLITCMSQASHGHWPRSDVISWCRQNGRSDRSGTVAHPATCHDGREGEAGSRYLGGMVPQLDAAVAPRPAPAAIPRSRVRGERRLRSGRVRRTARAAATAADFRLSRSLLATQSGQRARAGGSARPRLTNARAPC